MGVLTTISSANPRNMPSRKRSRVSFDQFHADKSRRNRQTGFLSNLLPAGTAPGTVFRPEEQYPSLCVCCSSCTDHCNFWKNTCCSCFTSKKIATHVGLSNGMAWGCCLGIACCGFWGNIAHGCVVTSKLREQYGFNAEEGVCCAVLSHWCCAPCALAQEEHLIANPPQAPRRGPRRQAM